MATKEIILNAASKQFGPTLVHAQQPGVGRAIDKVVLFAELCTPERQTIGIYGTVCSAANRPESRDVLVIVKIMGDGLVELPKESAQDGSMCIKGAYFDGKDIECSHARQDL